MTKDTKHVRILIPSEDADLSNERVWAVPHASIPNVYRVENVPLSPCGIAYGDWVECTPPKRKKAQIPHVIRVYQASGYGMIFAEIDETRPTRAADFFALVEALHALEWPLESMRDGYWLIAAVPPGHTEAADSLFAKHPGVKMSWSIDPFMNDPMQHPAALPMSIKTLTEAWKALTVSFEQSTYSPHDDLSEDTRAALRQLSALLDPLMGDESKGTS